MTKREAFANFPAWKVQLPAEAALRSTVRLAWEDLPKAHSVPPDRTLPYIREALAHCTVARLIRMSADFVDAEW